MIVSYNIDPKALDKPLGYSMFSLIHIFIYSGTLNTNTFFFFFLRF